MILPVFAVHGRQQAQDLRKLAPIVELLFPRHVTITCGPEIMSHMVDGFDPPPWVDCADHRGRALGLIRSGVPRVIFDGPSGVYAKLADIGTQCGVLVVDRLTAPCVHLRADERTRHVLALRLSQAGFEVLC